MYPAAPVGPTGAPVQSIASATASQVKDTERGLLNQLVGKMVDDVGTQSAALVTALEALAAAIEAKVSV